MNYQEPRKAVIWSQTNCQYCGMAKALLIANAYEVEERLLGEGYPWTKKDLLAVVPDARSVPQIFINDKYIGNYKNLKDFLYYGISEKT